MELEGSVKKGNEKRRQNGGSFRAEDLEKRLRVTRPHYGRPLAAVRRASAKLIASFGRTVSRTETGLKRCESP